MDLISVIVPVYNVEKYLDRCLKSITEQTYQNLEIILVDDGSPDTSGRICDEWAKRDNRIKVIHKQNGGLGYARNSGLEIATGKYVSFVDSDDYISLDMYEIMYTKLRENGADTCICGHYRQYINHADRVQIPFGDRCFKGEDVVNNILLSKIGSNPEEARDYILEMCVWHGLFSRDIINRNGIRFVSERELISEDIIFDLDYFVYSKVTLTISECLYYYCVNNVSLTMVYREDRFDKEIILYKEILRRIDQKNLDAKLRADRSFLGRVRKSMSTVLKSEGAIGSYGILKQVVNDSVLQAVLKDYPSGKMIFRYRIFNVLMKKKLILGMILYLELMLWRDRIR